MALLFRRLFDTGDTPEVSALLPTKPVVREDQSSMALPAGGVFRVGDIDSLDVVDLKLCPSCIELVFQSLSGVVVSLEYMGFNGSLLRQDSLLQRSYFVALDAKQFGIREIGQQVVLGKQDRLRLRFNLSNSLFRSSRCLIDFLILGNKLIDPAFKVDAGGMADEVDLSELIDQADEGNTGDGEVTDQLMVMFPSQESQVLDLIPSLRIHPLLDLLLLIIHTYSHDPHLPCPSCLVLHQHLLVVLHGALAGTTPGRPDVHQQHLSRFMLQMRLPLIIDIIDLPIITEGSSQGQGLFNVHEQSQLISFEHDGIELFLGDVMTDGTFDDLPAALLRLCQSRPFLNQNNVFLLQGGQS